MTTTAVFRLIFVVMFFFAIFAATVEHTPGNITLFVFLYALGIIGAYSMFKHVKRNKNN